MNTSFQVPHVSRPGLLQQSMPFYEFEYKSTPQERLDAAHCMLGEELIWDILSVLSTGCLSLKTCDSKCRRRCMAPMHKLGREHTPSTEIFGRILARFFRDKQKVSFYNICPAFQSLNCVSRVIVYSSFTVISSCSTPCSLLREWARNCPGLPTRCLEHNACNTCVSFSRDQLWIATAGPSDVRILLLLLML